MSNVWRVVDAYGEVGFLRASPSGLPHAGLPDGAELIEPHLAALEVPLWFPLEDPDREHVDLLAEMCAEAAGMVSLEAPRELDLLRARVVEMLRSKSILAFRGRPP